MIASRGIKVFLSNWMSFPLQLLTGILVVRVLGADGKGTLVLLMSAAAILAMIGQLGLPAAGVYLLRSGAYGSRTLLAHFLAASAAVVAAYAVAAAGAWFLFSSAIPAVLTAGGGILVIVVFLSIPSQMVIAYGANVLVARGDVGPYARMIVVMQLGTLALTALLILLIPMGVLGAAIAVVAPQVLAALYAAARLADSPDSHARLQRSVFRDMFRIGIGHYSGTIGSQMFKRLDSFILAYFLGTGPVGYYSVAMTAYEGVLSIPRALSAILGGEASARGEKAGALVVAQATRTILGVTLILGVIGGVLSIWLIPWLYGADFVKSVMSLQLLLFASAAVGATIALQSYFLGLGRPGIGGMLTLIAGVVNLCLSFALIPLWGIEGNALATLVASSFSLVLHLLWFHRLSGASIGQALLFRNRDWIAVSAAVRSALNSRLRRNASQASRTV